MKQTLRRNGKTYKTLKSAANENLGTIMGRNRRKYLKIWDNQIKQLIETRKASYKN
jgi:hypothetical protein